MGKKDLNYLNSLNNIGCVLSKMGKYEEALKHHQECLKIQEEVLGKTHPHYASSLNNIGGAFIEIGKY